jgi:hypothetical protein
VGRAARGGVARGAGWRAGGGGPVVELGGEVKGLLISVERRWTGRRAVEAGELDGVP